MAKQVRPKKKKPVPPIKKGKPWRAPGQETLTISEAAELLGVKPGTLRRMADQGTIPSFRIGGSDLKDPERRFYRQAIEDFRRAAGGGEPVIA